MDNIVTAKMWPIVTDDVRWAACLLDIATNPTERLTWSRHRWGHGHGGQRNRVFGKGTDPKGTSTERMVPELIPVLGSPPAGDVFFSFFFVYAAIEIFSMNKVD